MENPSIEYISKEQWEKLTLEQKREKDFVLIGNPNGINNIVNGKEYKEIGGYIPYSNKSDIVCEAYPNNLNKNDPLNRWGDGNAPVIFDTLDNSTKDWYDYNQEEDAVYMGVKSSGQTSRLRAAVNPFGVEIGFNFTVYFICKLIPPFSSSSTPFIGYWGSGNGGLQLYMTQQKYVYISSGGNGAIALTSAFNVNDYYIYCIQFDYTTKYGQACLLSVNEPLTAMAKTQGAVATLGTSLGFGTIGYLQSTTASTGWTSNNAVDMYVKYIAVINKLEPYYTVKQNMENLKQKFLVVE